MKKDAQTPLDYSLSELQSALQAWGYEPYRAAQIMDWIYKRRVQGFDLMRNIPQALRQKLQSEFPQWIPLQLKQKISSTADATVKYLFALDGGSVIEGVFIPHEEHQTICVSTQAGCPLQCAFCASGQTAWERNLTAGEIVGQVLLILEDRKLQRIQNVVIMGTGEPFLNYENVLRALEILTPPWGLGIARRKITISTAGILPNIKKFAAQPGQIRLSFSLHSPENTIRSQLMPVNNTHPLLDVLSALKDYVLATNRKIGVEYVLIEELNDSPQQAEKLAALVKDIAHSVNLIPLNPVEEFPHRAPGLAIQKAFKQALMEQGVKATLRQEKGNDVHAACGQLRLRHARS